MSRLHVTFGESAAGSLKLALQTLGREEEEVLPLVDFLCVGPIDPGDVHERVEWGIENIGLWEDAEEAIATFWTRVTTTPSEIVAWISRRDANEYCGFLELVWRVKGAPISVVDIAEVDFPGPDGTPSPNLSKRFGWVHDRWIVEKALFERARPVSDVERKRYEAEWRRLRQENGELRVLTDSGVASASVSHFDATILSQLTDAWQNCARIVGGAIVAIDEGPYVQFTWDAFIYGRLLALVDDEVVEANNHDDRWAMHETRARLAPSR